MGDAPVNQGSSRLVIRADRASDGRAMMPGGALVLCASGRIVGVEPAAPVPDGWPVAEFPRAGIRSGKPHGILANAIADLVAGGRTGGWGA